VDRLCFSQHSCCVPKCTLSYCFKHYTVVHFEHLIVLTADPMAARAKAVCDDSPAETVSFNTAGSIDVCLL
jgi:hypothetical protein